MLASILAMVLSNTGFAPVYDVFLEIPASVKIGELEAAICVRIPVIENFVARP